MKTYSVSFGQKIPIANCRVRNNETGKFVPAILYEYDCKDKEDIEEIKNLAGDWKFKGVVLDGMQIKKNVQEGQTIEFPNRFYALKDLGDETIGISFLYKRTNKLSKTNSLAVKFIETSPDKTYKYVGQAMLACHALSAMNDGYDRFEIRFPIDAAVPFYKEKCGFKDGEDEYTLEMTAKEIKKFLKKVFFKTHSKIEDIRRR